MSVLPIEGFRPTLTRLVALLDRLEIRYHLTGGVTSIVYSEPRMTQDVDLVLDPVRVREVREALIQALASEGFQFSESMVARAIDEGQMFQLLDVERSIKLDLYVRCLIAGELDRSVRVEIFPGVELPIVARSDAALSKLIWIEHGSHRSRRDLRQILAGASDEEAATVRAGAIEMGLSSLLDQVLAESDEVDV